MGTEIFYVVVVVETGGHVKLLPYLVQKTATHVQVIYVQWRINQQTK